MSEYQRRRNRARGTLIGLAAGDKNHGPSHMAWRLARSLSELGRFDPEDIFARYLKWHREGSFDTGRVAEIVFDRVLAAEPRQQAVDLAHQQLDGLTAGVNPAHRAAPMAMAAFIPDDLLEAAVRQEAALTHVHSQAGEAAAAVATLCRQLIRGVEWKKALEATAAGKSPGVALALQPNLSDRDDLSDGGFAPETLRAAVWHLNEAGSFDQALSTSLDFAGPANYCPVLVGAIGGARWGAETVSREHMIGHPLASELSRTANGLASMR